MPNALLRLAVVVAVSLGFKAFAYAGGIVGYSGLTVGTSCSACHAVTTGTAPTVAIAGPATLAPGATGNYTFTLTGGPGVRGGMNVAKDVVGGQLQADGVTTQASAGEITHNGARTFSGGSVVFSFRLVAPATTGPVKLFAAGNSCNNAGGSGGDREALTTFTVSVTNANAAPTVATAAAAASSTVTGTQVGLSVLGADDSGEAALTYTWAATGPAAPTFSANASNAAKSTTATFTRAGSYTFTATLRDAAGLTATSAVTVTVAQTLSQLTVGPASAGVAPSGTQQFTSTGADQFGQAQTVAPTWTVAGGGNISPGGLFTAGTTPGGPFAVTATQAGRTGTAQVTVSAGTPPTVATPAAAAQNPVVGTTVALSVLGADDGGAAALTYTWAALAPPSPVTFSANGTNAARATTATFTRAGQYAFVATVRDAVGLTVTSQVVVNVAATVTQIAVSPATITVAVNGTTQFTAAAVDQFAAPISPAPAFVWAVSGGGTVSAAGLFRAGTSAGGPFEVTAAVGAQMGMGQVTVSASVGPSVAQAPVATPDVVLGRTTTLRVLGADGAGEAGLVYRWSAAGAQPVSFSLNDSNAAKATVATFARAGVYTVTVEVANTGGQSAQATLTVNVRQALSGIAVAPVTVTVMPLMPQSFGAAQSDQFGQPLDVPVDVQWSVSGGGAIDASGRFVAREAAGGPWVVSAGASGLRGTAQVSVGGSVADTVPPTVAIRGAAPGAQVSGFVHLSLDAADAVGVAQVELQVDGARVALLTSPPFELDLDTVQFADGSHELGALARDTAGNQARAEGLTLEFKNGSGPAPVGPVVGEVNFGCSSSGSALALLALGLGAPLLRTRKGARRR